MSRPEIHIVATPLGNLDDLSPRAKQTLIDCDLIACEDTRNTGKLLELLELPKKDLVPYHDHNETQQAKKIIDRVVEKNLNLVLVSDAGTPALSDPGYRLIQLAHQRKVRVIPIPGCSAPLALACASGLPTSKILFTGFLPSKQAAARKEILSWQTMGASVIFFESARRTKETLKIIQNEFPEVRICVGRELTKMHEEIVTTTVEELIIWAETHENLKGELTFMISLPKINLEEQRQFIRDDARRKFSEGHNLKDLLQLYKDRGLSRSDLYQLLLEVKS